MGGHMYEFKPVRVLTYSSRIGIYSDKTLGPVLLFFHEGLNHEALLGFDYDTDHTLVINGKIAGWKNHQEDGDPPSLYGKLHAFSQNSSYKPYWLDPVNWSRPPRLVVFVKLDDTEAQIGVTEGKIKYIPINDLPDSIKTAVAMINTQDWDAIHLKSPESMVQKVSPVHWTCPPSCPKHMRSVGWRVDNHYAIVMDVEEFENLLTKT